MEPQEKLTTQQFIIDRLHDIQRKTEANNYTDALTSIKEVKAADVKNIYLIALEKQIIKLTDASLTPENRAEIIKSLPAMIDRAISDSNRRVSIPKPEEAQKGQKEAALEKLKSQYFQRADDYVEKGEYQRALEEIRRIYIIEPGSVVAKEYEQKIEQLATLHARSETPTEPITEAKEQSIEISAIETPKEVPEISTKAKKSKLPIIAAAAVVIIAVSAWLFFSRGSENQSEKVSIQQQTVTQSEESSTLPATSTPKPTESQPAAASTPKTITQTPKPTPEVTPVATKLRSTPATPLPQRTPITTQQSPARSQPQPAQPTPEPQATQPVVANPPAQPVQQPAPAPPKTESTPAPMPFVAIESPPEIVKREPAKYPEIAYRMRIEGRVVVEVTVDPQGKPIQAKVVRSSSDIFDEAAVDAALKSTYKPGMMSTGPITAKMFVPFDFRIKR